MEIRSLVCPGCQESFTTHKRNKRWCSAECRDSTRREAYRRYNPKAVDLPVGTSRALHSLRVVADLMARGWHVFPASTPHCPVHLIALRGPGRPVTFTVRAGYRDTKGDVMVSNTPHEGEVLALVVGGEIIYRPEL